jgi:poly(A) polymerase
VLREQEELDKIRPELDGEQIMRILGLQPGPLVGQAWNYLLELRLSEGMVGQERATQELLRWAAAEGLPVDPLTDSQ